MEKLGELGVIKLLTCWGKKKEWKFYFQLVEKEPFFYSFKKYMCFNKNGKQCKYTQISPYLLSEEIENWFDGCTIMNETNFEKWISSKWI